MTKSFYLIALVVSSLAAAGTAWSEGNAERGAGKAVVCGACHGSAVNPEWPSLNGLGEDYIIAQLKNFKEGKRANPIMMPNAMALSDEDMADIAAYFTAQPSAKGEADPAYWQEGEKLFRGGDRARGIPACMACHGPGGQGMAAAKFPALRGQHAGYVAKQLADYASGARTTGPNGIMQTIAKKLTADDVRNVASYVQGMR